MTMSQFEKSAVDRRQHDRRSGLKEGSPADQRQDQQMLAAINRARKAGRSR
jgi:hypothetical protein